MKIIKFCRGAKNNYFWFVLFGVPINCRYDNLKFKAEITPIEPAVVIHRRDF